MKKTLFFIFLLSLCLVSKSQNQKTYWGGVSVNEIADNSILIFEGRILTDSFYFQSPPGIVSTFHRVLVLKEFKGVFNSDTITVVNFGGRMILNGDWDGNRPAYARKGDEAVFFVSTKWNINPDKPDFFFIGYGDGYGFVKVCDKKDIVKDVYEPIEKATGQPYVEVHPNTCATQQKK